jgi:L-seryl-tRNA(Ser) seleniumtransferase
MMSLSLDDVRSRAEVWRAALGRGEVIPSESAVGGGSLPGECMATSVLALRVKSAATFLKKLRECLPPVIARIENDTILFDPRTVLDDEKLLANLKSLLLETE